MVYLRTINTIPNNKDKYLKNFFFNNGNQELKIYLMWSHWQEGHRDLAEPSSLSSGF